MLMETALGPTLQKVFLVYGAFWVLVLVVLFFAVGALMRRADRLRKRGGH